MTYQLNKIYIFLNVHICNYMKTFVYLFNKGNIMPLAYIPLCGKKFYSMCCLFVCLRHIFPKRSCGIQRPNQAVRRSVRLRIWLRTSGYRLSVVPPVDCISGVQP